MPESTEPDTLVIPVAVGSENGETPTDAGGALGAGELSHLSGGTFVAAAEAPLPGAGPVVASAAGLPAEGAPVSATTLPGAGAAPELPAGSAAIGAASEVAAAAVAAVEAGGEGRAVSAAAVTRETRAGGLQLSEEVGVAVAAYQRGAELPTRKDLLRFYVPDTRLTSLWQEIDAVEAEVVGLRRGSRQLVAELIDRLAAARNMLLHSRDQFENAQRELVLVRHRVARVRGSHALQQPAAVFFYLLFILLLVASGFAFAYRIGNFMGSPAEVAGLEPRTLWYTFLWGGVGGLSAAFFALKRHVEDFDQDHSRWYYYSPLLGFIFGPLVALAADMGLPALVSLTTEQAGANVAVRPALLYLLAWAVGFQQNLLLQMINRVLKRIFPDEEQAPAAPAAPQG